MKFVEDGTLQTLSKHLFAASGAMYSIATHLMTLQTLFSHPAEFARDTANHLRSKGSNRTHPANRWLLT